MMNHKILYVEDELFLAKIVTETLQKQFDVQLVSDGAKVMQIFNLFIPDICVVDIMLPNVDGYTLCRQIKSRFPSMPIIFLTAKTETQDLVKGFEAGGTDYMRKPFSMEELIVRIKNQLQLVKNIPHQQKSDNEIISIGSYKFNPSRFELLTPSTTIKLSGRDMQVLQIFISNMNQVVDRKKLLFEVWGDDSFFNSRTLDVYIKKIRDYFSEDKSIELVTLKGQGYLFLIP